MGNVNRAHMTSYLTLIETVVVSFSRYPELLSKGAYFSLPNLHLAPSLGETQVKFRMILASENYNPWHCEHDPMFSRFSRTRACDRLQTHTNTHAGS